MTEFLPSRAKRGNPSRGGKNKHRKIDGFFASLLAMTILVAPVCAEEAKPEEKAAEAVPPVNPGRFAPDFCDFEITFPEAPAIAKKCVPGNQCYDVHSYTMVYDLQTTVDVSVTCNPSTPAAYDKYTQGVMKAALAGMVEERSLTDYDMDFDQQENFKSASISGTGTTGQNGKIYTAQLWIGKNSVFTVQAELVGTAHPKGDGVFRDILASIKTKEGKQLPKKPQYNKKTSQ